MMNHPQILSKRLHTDDRGDMLFLPSGDFTNSWVTYNNSRTLRGLHIQMDVFDRVITVLHGLLVDICVDIWSGKVYKYLLTDQQSLHIPPGFLHGYYSERPSLVLYNFSQPYNEKEYHTVYPFDYELQIGWGAIEAPLNISDKDVNAQSFSDFQMRVLDTGAWR